MLVTSVHLLRERMCAGADGGGNDVHGVGGMGGAGDDVLLDVMQLHLLVCRRHGDGCASRRRPALPTGKGLLKEPARAGLTRAVGKEAQQGGNRQLVGHRCALRGEGAMNPATLDM